MNTFRPNIQLVTSCKNDRYIFGHVTEFKVMSSGPEALIFG